MVINGSHAMPDANYITVTTAVSSCDNSTLDLNQIVLNLRNLYQSNVSNLTANVFSNVSIINFNCTSGLGNYFEQMITFTQSVSIRIQILFVSIYFDYLTAVNFRLNGFIIQRETNINLSSITLNNSVQSDACSSAEVAQDPLCLTNSINPLCTISSNKWNFTCSQSLLSTTTYRTLLQTAAISSGLNPWRLGLICGFSVFFVLLLIILSGYFYRRYTHSKQLTLSHVNLYDDAKLTKNSGIPQGQAFQRATTIVQPKRGTNTAISWIHNGTTINTGRNDENYINIKLPNPYAQVTFVDHAKVHDPSFPSNRTVPKVSSPSQPVAGTSMNQLKSITDELQEDTLNESDNISLPQSIPNSPKIPSTPALKHFANLAFIDENLTDEDAWMCILEVVNSELALLDEQDRTRTLL